MIGFLARRIIHGVIVVLLVLTAVFLVTRVVVDPAVTMLPQEATAEQREEFRESLGLNDSLLGQAGAFAADVGRLDFGESLWRSAPALDVAVSFLPATIELIAAAIILSVLVFIPLGLLASIRPGSWLDKALVTSSFFGVSMPQFWLGAMLILLFGVHLGWLPTSGRGALQHLILPAVTLSVMTGGRLAEVTRSAAIEQFNLPYVRTARAKGFRLPYITLRHVLRNASVPIVTMGFWEVIRLFAGASIVVEIVFAWPGIGRLAVQAVRTNDIVLIQAIVFVVALIIVTINVLVDILYKLIDPRVEVA